MDLQNIELLLKYAKEYGPITIIFVYLAYNAVSQGKDNTDQLKEITNILVQMSTQISILLSANISYRNGDKQSGDSYSEEAVKLGREVQDKFQDGVKKYRQLLGFIFNCHINSSYSIKE